MKGTKTLMFYASLTSLAVLLALTAGCGSNRDSADTTTTVQTDEEILRATSYVGTDRCSGCHEEIHDSWMVTAHTQKLRPADEGNFVNDSDGSGRSDFFDAAPLSLQDDADFDQFGDAAPILGDDQNGPYFEISGTKYYIVYTLGGSGFDEDGDGLALNDESQWKQRYITKIGDSHYIGPVQFNGQTGEYVTYHPEDWWAVDGDLSPTGDPVASRSYERRCAGCHVTGLQIALDEADEEWTMDFVDNRVACEACHGPGGRHATNPLKENIVNPATLEASTDLNDDGEVNMVDHLIVREAVCSRCHNRGSGFFEAFGSTTGYPSLADENGNLKTYLPGADEDLLKYFDPVDPANDPGRFWLDPSIDNEANPTEAFIASSSHRQQHIGFGFGPHAPDKSYDATCFDCHDPHGPNPNMDQNELVEGGVTVATAIEDNTLCQACHAGHGPFAETDPVDVNTESPALKGETANHTTHIFDPEDSGASQCKACHMPETAKSAVRAGNDGIGDVPSHAFSIITPQQTIDTIGTESAEGVPNSCNAQGCHNNPYDVETEEADYIAFLEGLQADFDAKFVTQDSESNQWLASGHGDFTAEAFSHWEEDGEVSASCAECHSSTGLREHGDESDSDDDTVNEPVTAQSLRTNIVDCRACHVEGGSPDFRNDTSLLLQGQRVDAGYDFGIDDDVVFQDGGKSNTCFVCHSGRGNMDSYKLDENPSADMSSLDAGFGPGTINVTEAHYKVAAATIYADDADPLVADQVGPNPGTHIGYEYAGQNYNAVSFFSHDEIGQNLDTPESGPGPCVGCHMETAEGHTWEVVEKEEIDEEEVITALNSTRCVECHDGGHGPALVVEDTTIDGTLHTADDAAAFLQAEAEGYHETMEILEEELASDGVVWTGGYPYFSTGTNGWVDEGTFGAAHNFNYLHHEPGAYAHNRYYAKRLLFDSIDWVDNGVLDGTITIDAATYPEAAHWLGADETTGVATRP